MSAVQKAIFPAIVLSSLLLFTLNHFVQPQKSVNAATQEPIAEEGGAEMQETEPEECASAEQYPEKVVQYPFTLMVKPLDQPR